MLWTTPAQARNLLPSVADSHGVKQVKLTVSIVVIGDQPLVLDCLESIEEQTCAEYKVCLVANGSSQSFLQKIAERHPKVEIVQYPNLRSFAANHNSVMQRCDTEFLLLLNDDTVILDSALDRMVGFLQDQPREVGIAGCTNLTRSGEFVLTCYPFPSAGVVVSRHAGLGRVAPGRGYQRYLAQAEGAEPFPVDWVQGSCILIRRDVIEEIGQLDEGFFLFSEEVDYCYRARQAGFSTHQVPTARILHHESATTRRFVSLKLRGHYISTLYFLAKHGFTWDLWLVRAWYVCELLIKSAIRGIGALVGRPPDAMERLQAYLDLVQICVSYHGQLPAELLALDGHWVSREDACTIV